MNKMQQQLVEFHKAMNQPVGETVEFRSLKLRHDLIREESQELLKALLAKDMVEVIDGLCDLIYVVVGTAVDFGIDIEPFFDEVHRTNMLKTTGPIREDGKRLKPEGWQPPRIAEMLENLSKPKRKCTAEGRKGSDCQFEFDSIGKNINCLFCGAPQI